MSSAKAGSPVEQRQWDSAYGPCTTLECWPFACPCPSPTIGRLLCFRSKTDRCLGPCPAHRESKVDGSSASRPRQSHDGLRNCVHALHRHGGDAFAVRMLVRPAACGQRVLACVCFVFRVEYNHQHSVHNFSPVLICPAIRALITAPIYSAGGLRAVTQITLRRRCAIGRAVSSRSYLMDLSNTGDGEHQKYET